MYKQLEYLREGITMTRGQTYRIDLPLTGFLSSILLKLSAPCTSGATLADPLWRLRDHFGTVELIGNGSTIIKSADLVHHDYLSWLRGKVPRTYQWRNYATNTQFEYVLINLGRYPGDPEFGLDLSKWDNVELRVTNSSSATYHSADITASIQFEYLRDHAQGFRGFLRTELWREWTTVSDEWKYFTLPSEFPIAGVYLRAVPDDTSGVMDTNFANLMYDIEFKMSGGTKNIYIGGLDDLALWNYYEDEAVGLVSGHADINADRGVPISLGRVFGQTVSAGDLSGAIAGSIPTMKGDLTDGDFVGENREADAPLHFIFMGYAFEYSAHLWHSKSLDPGELLDPKVVGETTLNIHTRSGAAYADGTAQVILDRVVS